MKRHEPRRLSPHAVAIQNILTACDKTYLEALQRHTNNWALRFLIRRELRLKRAKMRLEEKRETRRRRNIAKYLSDSWKV